MDLWRCGRIRCLHLIQVLRFRVLGSSFSRFGCFVLRSSFSSASFSILPGEDEIAITSWSEEIEDKIAMVDEDVDKLAAFLTEAEQRETEKARQEQLEFEKELIERKFRYHKELEEKDQQDSILTGNQDAKTNTRY